MLFIVKDMIITPITKVVSYLSKLNGRHPIISHTVDLSPSSTTNTPTISTMAGKDLSFLTNSTSSRLEATAQEKAKREAELQEMRRLRAEQQSGQNVDWDNGAAPITDIEGWRNSQKSAAEEERRKKMEAAEGLHGYRGKEVPVGKKKDRDSKVFKQWEGKGRSGEEGEDVDIQEHWGEENVESVSGVDVKKAAEDIDNKAEDTRDVDVEKSTDEQPSEPEPAVEEKEADVEQNDSTVEETAASEVKENPPGEEEAVEGSNDAPTTAEADDAVQAEEIEEEKSENHGEKEHAKQDPVELKPTPQPEAENTPEAEEKQAESEPVAVSEPVQEEPPAPTPPPTYSRTDVKFSFGLIVRSNHPTGNFDENLRENETLRKCMASTSKILIKEMPSPPEIVEGEEEVDYSTFPKAYYDPSLAPTVLSIEEDKKDSSEMMEKGNKRTLVKASFPVFLQDTEGEDKSKALLKETKSTVFKALRAAVSGGQFLR